MTELNVGKTSALSSSPRGDVTLFLDIDGVLHRRAPGAEKFTALPQLQQSMRRHSRLEVVISSSWREVFDFEDLVELFDEDLRTRIVDSTPVLEQDTEFVRQRECEHWMRTHRSPYQEWVALEDEKALFEPGCPQLLFVDGSKGLQLEDCMRLDERISEALARITELKLAREHAAQAAEHLHLSCVVTASGDELLAEVTCGGKRETLRHTDAAELGLALLARGMKPENVSSPDWKEGFHGMSAGQCDALFLAMRTGRKQRTE
ncbi:HAD domain-containing protein [Hydrogenophaga sp. PML113]|uniref:HAD domain-containing protein n=1 Tax=Hydrogenophaga sp. PML113 TaxID=1899350 RepID=UPI000AEFBC0B|nr:HAD domain-containing protein [Hydrogenophaga sp. PML113]